MTAHWAALRATMDAGGVSRVGFLAASAPQGMRQVSGLLPAQPAATGTDYPLAQPSATCLLGPRPESVKTGRDFTQATLLDWDMAALADVAELVVSELVTNSDTNNKNDAGTRRETLGRLVP